MAVVSVDINAFIKDLLQLGERIYKAGQNRSNAWEEYRSKVSELLDLLNFYNGLESPGHQLPDQLREALRNATTEVEKFKEKPKTWGPSRPDPQKLEKTVSKLIEDISVNIPKRLGMQKGIAEKWAERKPIKRIIHNNDDSYVPTEKTLSAVIEAIGDQTGPSIILLHGEFGKGKTTLAKYVFHLYSEPRSKAGTKRRGIENHDFKLADIVDCRGVKLRHASKKQESILQKLSPGEFSEGSVGAQRTEDNFRNFLSKNKTLVILDDVSDEGFLLAMWNAAPEGGAHKYLVTSRLPTLCNSLEKKKHSKIICMEEATEEEAKKILAVHAGLKHIPSKLEGVAKEIIEKTGRNPLALACWAGALRHDNANEQAWVRGCSDDLTTLLDNKERKFVLWDDHEKVPQSFWEAVEGCFQSLHMNSKLILFFIYACKGTPVPEELLRNLHRQVETTKHNCEWSLNELSVKGLVKSRRDGLELYEDLESKHNDKKQHRKSRTMSLTPLGNLYMFCSKFRWADNPEIVSVTNALVNGWGRTDQMGTKERDEARVAILLCALYFDRNHSDQIVTDARAAAASHMKDADIDKKRHAVEPVIWLLDQPRQDWKDILWSARKVFLKYIWKGGLDDFCIRTLLNSSDYPQVQLAALETLLPIVTMETIPLIRSSSRGLLKALTGCLDSKKGLIKDTAFKTVEYIVENQVKFLSEDKPDKQQLEAARVLTTLASTSSDRMRETIVDRALKALVDLLNLDKGPLRKTQAALALRNLASTREKKTKEKILNEALAGLVGCLFEDKNSDLQEATASALEKLAAMERAFKLKIVKERKALTGLIYLFNKPDKPGLQKQAAATLKSLAFGNDATKEQIVNADKMLECFAMFLSKDEEDSVLELVAGALRGLASSENDSIKKKIVETPKVLEGLVKVLSKQDKPGMQTEAAGALNKLSLTADESVRRKIKNQPRLFHELTAASEKDKRPNLQTRAKEALKNLG